MNNINKQQVLNIINGIRKSPHITNWEVAFEMISDQINALLPYEVNEGFNVNELLQYISELRQDFSSGNDPFCRGYNSACLDIVAKIIELHNFKVKKVNRNFNDKTENPKLIFIELGSIGETGVKQLDDLGYTVIICKNPHGVVKL